MKMKIHFTDLYQGIFLSNLLKEQGIDAMTDGEGTVELSVPDSEYYRYVGKGTLPDYKSGVRPARYKYKFIISRDLSEVFYVTTLHRTEKEARAALKVLLDGEFKVKLGEVEEKEETTCVS